MQNNKILLKKVCVHNLKGVDLSLNKNELIVFTGVSGSGKSSLAFDTIYIEGQRRYVESLSTFARRQIGEMNKPDLEHASGISPTISIEQKTAGRNPRSTVGTLTEIYDYLRVLYARIGTPHCPVSGEAVKPQSYERMIKTLQSWPHQTKIILLAPYARDKKGEFQEEFQDFLRKGFTRLRIDGHLVNLNDSLLLDGNVNHHIDLVVDRLSIEPSSFSRLADSVSQALEWGNGSCIVLETETQQEHLFSMHAYSPQSGLSYPSLEPHDFSFNHPAGMCLRCNGMGKIQEFNLEKVLNPSLSIAEDCFSIASSYQTIRYKNIYDNLAEQYHFSVNKPWNTLSPQAQKIFLYGTDKKWTRIYCTHPVTGAKWVDLIQWKGILNEAHTRFTEAKSDFYRKKMEALMTLQTCSICQGERLKAYPAATLFQGKRIHELTSLTIRECQLFFDQLTLSPQEFLIAEELFKEIRQRLQFLIDVGLHYLTLDRTAPTLSGGEAQRVRLASQVGCGLVGITYVLDEPSIGLHPRDNRKLIETLKHLRDMGNTVIVVEHDEETILESDRIVDFGPGAGVRGGEILVNGTLIELMENPVSITGAYLSGKREIPIPKSRRQATSAPLLIEGARHHNLKNLTISIPLGLFVAVTGVSGSGKSSLISDILYPALANSLHQADLPIGEHQGLKGIENIDKVIAIDQSPIGRNPRSNPSTYIKLFDEIRHLFTLLPESQARGYKPGRFSFNVKEGSCTQCEGMGQIKIDMDFLEEAWITCPLCQSKRFDEDTLSILYKEKNIHDILEMSVEEALIFFQDIPKIQHKLQTLKLVGMGYIKLGQSSTTLSGGEAQRIKLAKELARPATGKTFYILDEPTTGLHFHDIKHLLEVLQTLVSKGNTVLTIEHQMDVVKTADWIIDLGPEGGEAGGQLIAEGTPEEIAKLDTPTGIAVREALHIQRKQRKPLFFQKEKHAVSDKKNQKELIHTIQVNGAEQNNLKYVSTTIPRDKITVCTGPSGSGKSSFAFETIYAEGQRRYIESLSPYARQFVKQMSKPKVASVSGLSPAIAIEQKAHAGNPRSTVGTLTEIYDYLRILFACIGIPHCPQTGEVIKAIHKEDVVNHILQNFYEKKLYILAPIEIDKQDRFQELILRLKRQGFIRIRLNGVFYSLDKEEENFIPFDRKRKNDLYLVMDRIKSTSASKTRLYEAIEKAASFGKGKLVLLDGEKEISFNLAFAVESTGKTYPEITPHTFAFNTAEGMCPDCTGLGYQYGAQLMYQPDLLNQSVKALLGYLWQEPFQFSAFAYVESFLKAHEIDPHLLLSELPIEKIQLLMQGGGQEEWLTTSSGLRFRWQGIDTVLAKAGKNALTEIKQAILPLLQEQTCLSCQGSRLHPLARCVTINGVAIHELCHWQIEKAWTFIQSIQLNHQEKKLLEEVMSQLNQRCQFLCEVGLHYLSLDRSAPSLSGGEAQRIRLARQLGSGLTQVLYVLDEPTIGLHPRDNARLNEVLKKLKQLGNTLLLVEHDPLTIATADYILDFGPQAGQQGGYITAQGTVKQLMRNSHSLTGLYLSGKKEIPLETKRRALNQGFISIRHASKNNLKQLDLDIPVGVLTCLTGVSGSGKSTLLQQILLPAAAQRGIADSITIEGAVISGLSQFDKVISINQNPVGHTIRSDVGTYIDAFTIMREFFSSLPTAKSKGLQPKHFSYNHRKGMCTTCQGLGYRLIEMHFLPSVKIICEECKGLRLNPLSLEITYEGKNLGQYLMSTIEEIRFVFQNHPRVTRLLDLLISVGLGYLKLGQETASLSGGEAQRLKLCRELIKRATGSTLYLLDEPTTGLHSEDIQKLLNVLQRLVDKGNTMVIIEHHLDMIKNADFLIDLGPEAGEKGGEIMGMGTPEELLSFERSWTGKYLKPILKPLA